MNDVSFLLTSDEAEEHLTCWPTGKVTVSTMAVAGLGHDICLADGRFNGTNEESFEISDTRAGTCKGVGIYHDTIMKMLAESKVYRATVRTHRHIVPVIIITDGPVPKMEDTVLIENPTLETILEVQYEEVEYI